MADIPDTPQQIPVDAVEPAAELLERRVKKPALDGRLISRLATAGAEKKPLARVQRRIAAGKRVQRRAQAALAKAQEIRGRVAELDNPEELTEDARIEQKIAKRDLMDRLDDQGDEVIERSRKLIAERTETVQHEQKHVHKRNGKPRRRQWMRI